MEQHRGKFALGRLIRIIVTKLHRQLVDTTLPQTALLARNLALPLEQVGRLPVLRKFRLGSEAERMLLPPVFPLLGQPLLPNVHI